MIALATTTGSILRGTAEDEFGDEQDTATVHATGIPASLIESGKSAYDPVTSMPRVIRTHVLRLPADSDVLTTDRWRDDVTGDLYAITSITKNTNPAVRQDLRVDLVRVSTPQ